MIGERSGRDDKGEETKNIQFNDSKHKKNTFQSRAFLIKKREQFLLINKFSNVIKNFLRLFGYACLRDIKIFSWWTH